METTQWIVAITQNLIAAIIVWGFSYWVGKNRESINKVMGVAIPATRRMMPIVFHILMHVFVFWFFITQIRDLIADPAPIKKIDVFLIAFWTTWLVVYFIRVVLERERS